MSLPALKELQAQIDAVADAHRPGEGLPTGIDGVDRALLGRGIPRGRLTEVVGTRGSGKTTFVRGVVARAVERGEWVVYIDAARTLAPRDWSRFTAESSGVWMVRPRSAGRAAWCADVLLRSGAFGLVIIDGAPPLTRSTAARLTRLARDGGAALVVTTDDDAATGTARGACFPAVRLRVARLQRGRGTRAPRRWRESPERSAERPPGPRADAVATVITVEKGGSRRTVEVRYGWSMARRLCAHPEVPDRRGVERASTKASERSGAKASAARPSLAPPTAAPPSRVAPRSTRCAEPSFGTRRAPRTLGAGGGSCGGSNPTRMG